MAKFNVVQKQRRAAIAERKRAVKGDPLTKKLKHEQPPLSVSGKRKRKLFKKWRRDQKAAAAASAALTTTMQDVEMSAVAQNDDNGSDGTSQDDATKLAPKKFHMKRSSKYKVGRFKKRDKNRRKSDNRAAQASKDAMEE